VISCNYFAKKLTPTYNMEGKLERGGGKSGSIGEEREKKRKESHDRNE
jgi:hypothetical protein